MKTLVRSALFLSVTTALLTGCATTHVTGSPDVLLKEGDRYFQKGNYEEAITLWKKVKESYQSPELTTQAEINIADAYFLNKDYIESAAAYEDFRKLHPKHERAGFALFRQALSHFNQIQGIDTDQTPVKNALVTFQSYLTLYPAGEHLREATEKIAACRDKQLQYEIYVGKFYLKSEKYPAAIGRFEAALKAFPDQSGRDEVLFHLGRAYQQTGQPTKAQDNFARLIKEFPASRFAGEAGKLSGK